MSDPDRQSSIPDDQEVRQYADRLKAETDIIIQDFNKQLESLVDWKSRVERIGPHVGVDPESYKDLWVTLTKLATLEVFDKLTVLIGGPEASDEVVGSLFPRNN